MSLNNLIALGGGKRYAYLDCLRGFTMLLVIWHHVATMSFGLRIEDSFLMELFISFRMPMFFFISGYIAYKSSEVYSLSVYKTKLLKKAQVQLIPTLVFWLAGILILKGKSILEIPATFAGWFPGFWWFTEALFIMFFIYYTAELIGYFTTRKVALPLMIVVAILLSVFKNSIQAHAICSYFTLSGVARFFMFFVFGLYLRKYSLALQSALAGRKLITTCIIVVK